MHFHKYQYPGNFEFPSVSPNKPFRTPRGTYKFKVTCGQGDVYQLKVTGKGWSHSDSLLPLAIKAGKRDLQSRMTRLVFDKDTGFKWETKKGTPLLTSEPGRLFGQCGEASLFEFIRSTKDQFYGMGEKFTGFEHSNKTTKFWNTDVWADFHSECYINATPPPDPAYVSVPYLILKRGNTYIGLLLDNPHATFISTRQEVSIAGQMKAAGGPPKDRFVIGAEQGQPNLYLIYGPTLAELTRKLQTLVGCTPRPPAWALGYHQCRWGYRSASDLNKLDTQFRKHNIPVDGLWLDIDYMRGYRVFTFDEKHFPDPKNAMARLAKTGRKVVPIIDPGIKLERGYDIYERGRRAGAYCLNPQGKEFVGLVWPGETVFPDFSTEAGRSWWAGEVAAFARNGLQGAWLDMNDPATGPSDNQAMLFDNGRKSHSYFHNQYALGMAAATREGFLTAQPDRRPFLLSRSGSTGTSRYSAIWTGDNYSNYGHLKNSIPTTLNLALSGIPFNGPDAGGFGGDTTPELMIDWFKAGFLFPFFRNHSIINSRQQEPWAFDKKTLATLRRYIQLRYRLRPYLYQLFIQQEETGEAILRPLFYDFQDTDQLPLGLIDDQFMVGPCIMQAPFVVEKQKARDVVLPGKTQWYDLSAGRWINGGKKIRVRSKPTITPIYIRDGSILPLARLAPGDAAYDGKRVDFHIFLSGNGCARTRYTFDDGESFAYRSGAQSEVDIIAQRSGDELSVQLNVLANGFGAGDFTITAPTAIRQLTYNGKIARRIISQRVPLSAGKLNSWLIG